MGIHMDIRKGCLDSEPELHVTRKGRRMRTFGLTVSLDGSRAAEHGESFRNGRDADITQVVMYGEKGGAMQPLLQKGARVVVLGWTQSRRYTALEGTRRMVIETVAERIALQLEMREDRVLPCPNSIPAGMQTAGDTVRVDSISPRIGGTVSDAA